MRIVVRVVHRIVASSGAAAAMLLVAACGGAATSKPAAVSTEPAPASRPYACIADRVPARLIVTSVQDCRDAEYDRCDQACQAGDASACRQLAQDLEAGADGDFDTEEDADVEGAARLYARGCHLGDAAACTNYGAYLLHDHAGVGTDLACAARLHAMSCDAGEPWGCGMRGLELGRGIGVAKDLAAARALLERSCSAYGGFPCEMLAELGSDETAAE